MHLHHYNVITSCLYQLAVVSYHVLLISYHYVIWYVMSIYVYMVSRFRSQRFLLIFNVVQFVPKCPKSSDQSANELLHPDPILPAVLPGCPSRMLRELLKVFLFCTKVLSKVKLETNQKQIRNKFFCTKFYQILRKSLMLHFSLHFVFACTPLQQVPWRMSQKSCKVFVLWVKRCQRCDTKWQNCIEMSSCRCIWLFWCSCCTALPRLAWPRTTLPRAMTSAVIAPTLWLCVIRKWETVGSARCNALKLRTGYRYRRYTGIHITPHELE